ncbi:TPA: hypothetical protein DEP86_00795 [Candidatus Uhrbacteria bacterium]|nr:hypothetical protein [Candidatus Uhrbacteria bacterium]
MDKISRREIRRVLLEGVRPTTADQVISVLGPLIVNAEKGMYLLSPGEDVSDEDVQCALGLALNNRCADIIRLSLTIGPFPKPVCMSVEFYRKILDAFLAGEIDRKVSFALSNHYCQNIQRRCTSLVGLENNFHDLLGKRLRIGLKNAVRRTECIEKQCEDGWREAYRVVKTAVTYYLAFAQLGDEDGLNKIEPLVQQLPQTIPIGCATFCFERKFVLVR